MNWKRLVIVVGVVVCLPGTFRPVEGLRCRTSEGPSTEDVKRIVRTCLNKITNAGENRSTSDEYPNYDSSYSSDDSSEERQGMGENGKMAGNRRGARGRYDGNDRGNDNGRMNRPEDGDRRQMDGRGQGNSEGRNGRPRMEPSDRGQRERYDDGDDLLMMRDYGRQQHRSKRQYYGGQGPPMGGGTGGSGGDFSSGYGRTPQSNSPGQNATNGTQRNSSLERDRACLMQCFFEELKATNADGFPEQHKVMHVITKDIRERELREFYVDSIQECFRMIGMDSRLKDKCDYSMRFVTCLTDRFQSNCDDWDIDTSAMF
uniref:Odorant-binding protein 29 n=1 Tax=Anopheles atroparvus TaxID=41427 RepID=A0A182J4Y9_ANOAO